jgi:hypothetical protein
LTKSQIEDLRIRNVAGHKALLFLLARSPFGIPQRRGSERFVNLPARSLFRRCYDRRSGSAGGQLSGPEVVVGSRQDHKH